MGGARCSYRTCTIRSDRKTHLFHFPVFDKTRCHRWITNAQRLNFLDLKLSQLRNRRICEHHFTDECFMNVTKGRLKNDAVPTEDGPYCVKFAAENDDDCQIPINLDDIEEDYLSNMEKRANWSVKYGDFLINDVPETMQTNEKNIDADIPNYKTTSIKLQDKCLIFNRRNSNYGSDKPQNTPCKSANDQSKDIKEIDIVDNEKITIPDPVSSLLCHSKPLPGPKVVAIEFEEFNLTEQGNKSDKETVPIPPRQNFSQSFVFPTHTVNANSIISMSAAQQFGQPAALPSDKVKPNKKPIPSSKKVKILSEESFPPLPKALESVKVKGELKTVSPLLQLGPDIKKRRNVLINGTEIETLYFKMASTEQSENLQEVNHSSILSSQPIVTNQVCNLNELDNNILLVNQIEGTNNVQVQNELLTANQPADANHISSHIKMEPELLPDMQHFSIVSNVDCVSASVNQPSVSTILDVPIQDTSLLTDSTSTLPNVTIAPTCVQNSAMLLSTDTETSAVPAGNKTHCSSVSNSQNVSEICRNMKENVLDKKQSTLQSSPNKTVLKSKLTPEKLAAIEVKRKFNTKLKGILNSCLSNLDEEPETNKLSAAIKRKLADKKVGQYLSEDSTLPTHQENTIAYLEARLQRMEDTLLNKIEQNSTRISDLKRTLKPSSGKKSAYTQTYFNAETAKKQMYQQISQFLSPETKSMVYEELFINSCIDNSSNEKPHKKRKRR